MRRPFRVGLFTLALLASVAVTARGEPVCDPDRVQESGSIYRICMPVSGYNGILVVVAHGFQDAGTPVSIPEDQLSGLPDIINGLGFAFATNSYSKTGLAIVLVGFAIMLLYDGVLEEVSGTASFFTAPELAAFERLATAARVPYRRGGASLAFKVRQN